MARKSGHRHQRCPVLAHRCGQASPKGVTAHAGGKPSCCTCLPQSKITGLPGERIAHAIAAREDKIPGPWLAPMALNPCRPIAVGLCRQTVAHPWLSGGPGFGCALHKHNPVAVDRSPRQPQCLSHPAAGEPHHLPAEPPLRGGSGLQQGIHLLRRDGRGLA